MIDPERTLVIANPAARGGFVRKNWKALESTIRGELGTVSFAQTAGPGDAAALAAEAGRAGMKTVVSYGGDGTHGEVADGLMRCAASSRPALGILHAGTGGDFRRMLVDGHDLAAGCRRIASSTPTPVDVGHVEHLDARGAKAGRFFLNLTSVGMGGLIDRYVSEGAKHLGGTLGFGVSTLRAQLTFRPPRVRVEVDGIARGDLRVHVVCVANGRFAGGGMMFAPEARLSDGRFDVVAIEAAPLARLLPVFAGLYSGSHVRSSLVRTWRGRAVRVTPLDDGDALMDIDGEAPGVAPATFEMHERAIALHGLREEVR